MFQELRRRNVHRVAIAYLAGAWLLVQVVETLMPAFDLSSQVLRVVLILLAVGFVPAIILAWVFEWTPEGFQREAKISSESPRMDSHGFDRAIIVVLVAAVAFFAIDRFVFDPARDEARVAAATEDATRRALSGVFYDAFRDRSVLVVPFLNLSSDTEQEYFADGISEEILNLLARIQDLRVISRSTSWMFKGKDVDVAETQRKLNLSHLLEGSVRKSGNQVRITAQLIDARTDSHLWSETYDRTLDDIFAIQDEIALAVAEKLHIEVFDLGSPHEGIDPRAYDLYLRASAQLEYTEQNDEFEPIKKMLEEALAIEPDYLPALFDLTFVIWQLPQYDDQEAIRAAREEMLALIDRMEKLAPEAPYANNWRAWVEMRWNGDYVAAAPYIEKSMRYANRTDVWVWFRGAIELLGRLGRHEEATVVGQYWIDRDPACGGCLGGVAAAMRYAGRHKDAARIIESVLEWREVGSDGYWNIGVAFLGAGEPEKALHYFNLIDKDNNMSGFSRAFAHWSLGRVDEFNAYLEREIANFPERSAEGIARLYAWSNQRDKAFEWLEKMVEQYGEQEAMGVKTDLYAPIKADPRWQAFLEKYGAEDKPIGDVKFKPKYPPVLQHAVDEIRGRDQGH